MLQDHTSDICPKPVELNQKLDVGTNSVRCPCCDNDAYVYLPDLEPDEPVFVRCMPMVGGCGVHFWFDQKTHLLTRLEHPDTSSEPQSLIPTLGNLKGLMTELRDVFDDDSSQGPGTCERAEAAGTDSERRSECVESPETDPNKLDNGVISGGNQKSDSLTQSYQNLYVNSDLPTNVAKHVSKQHLRRDHAHKIAQALRDRKEFNRAKRVEACSTEVCVRRWLDDGGTHVSYADWCQSRILCPNCERARSAQRLAKWVPRIIEAIAAGNYVPWFLTLTVKDGKRLRERTNHLLECFKRANQRRRDFIKGRGRKRTEFGKIRGAMWAVEVKRGKNSNLWHPHLHGLCLLPRGESVDAFELSKEWKELTGDSKIVDARMMTAGRLMMNEPDKSAHELFKNEHFRTELLKGVCETLKYTMKYEFDQDPADYVDVFYTLFGKTLHRPWGCLRGLRDIDKITPDSWREGEYVDYWFRYLDSTSRYQLQRQVSGVASPEEEATDTEIH